jgi:hypothetical protein
MHATIHISHLFALHVSGIYIYLTSIFYIVLVETHLRYQHQPFIENNIRNMVNMLAFTMLLLLIIATVVPPFSYAVEPQSEAFEGGTNESGGAKATEAAKPNEGPKFVEMVIKNPFLPVQSSKSDTSDGLLVDPTPEGSEN